jgi:hypothetical protein
LFAFLELDDQVGKFFLIVNKILPGLVLGKRIFYLSRGILRYSRYVFALADRRAAAASVSQAQPQGV